MAAPAPAIISRVSAIWPPISAACVLRPFTSPVVLRVFDCMIWLTSGRESCQAGQRPKRIPVLTATTTQKIEDRHIDLNGRFMREGELGQVGNDDGDRFVREQRAQGRRR